MEDSGGHTRLERLFLALVRRAGLPRPRTEVIHRRGTRTFARVDFCFDERDLVVEVSGQHGHASDAERSRDAQRRNELRDVGRRVLEFRWWDVTRRPDHVISILTTALDSSSSGLWLPQRPQA